MPRKLKPVGEGSAAEEAGYTLAVIISWLEDIAMHEEDRKGKAYEARAARLAYIVAELNDMDEA